MHTSMPTSIRQSLEVDKDICEAVSRRLLPVSWESRAKDLHALRVKSALANVFGELTALDSEVPAPPNDCTLQIQPTLVSTIAVDEHLSHHATHRQTVLNCFLKCENFTKVKPSQERVHDHSAMTLDFNSTGKVKGRQVT